MAKKEKQDFQSQSVEHLREALKATDRELFDLRNELSTQKKLAKPHLLKERKKDKARILTALTKKQNEAGV